MGVALRLVGVFGVLYFIYVKVKDKEWFGRIRNIVELFKMLYYTRKHASKYPSVPPFEYFFEC